MKMTSWTKFISAAVLASSTLVIFSSAFTMPSSPKPKLSALPSIRGHHVVSMSNAVETEERATKKASLIAEEEKAVNGNNTDDADAFAMDVESQMMQQRDERSPVEIENEKFDCDESVAFWREFQIDGFDSAEQNLQNLAQVAAKFAQNPESLDYFLRHGGRTAYFISNAILGNVGFRLHELVVNRENTEGVFEYMIRDPSVVSRIFLECALSYEQDWKRIKEGQYNKPYDMYQRTRQSSPLFFGQQTARFVREAIGTLGRRKRAGSKDKKVWLFEDAAPSLYPDYYRNAFHYQTDGWMSQASADVYETSTETLFLGRQDAMQRTSLPALVERSKEVKGRPMKVLEVAAGTGRFMTFARDSLPLDTRYTVSDLSPFYLNAARDNDSNWRRVRTRAERERGNQDVTVEPTRFVQAKAEDLPFQDEEFDAVVCIYLFHEIPREVRSRVAAEMARVVRPGGRVIFTDSVQLGDRPIFDATMGNFQNMNEPHYQDYIEDNLPSHFENAGLKCLKKIVLTSTKSLSFVKPDGSEL